MPPSEEVQCQVVATREPDSPVWSFYLVNEGSTVIESAILAAVKYEWGDEYVGGESPDVRVDGLSPAGRALLWRSDGESEMREDLWIRVTHRGLQTWLLFEFPKLYRQQGTTLIGYRSTMASGPD